MILACICIGIPCLIFAALVWECRQARRQLDKARRELEGDK